MLEASLLHPKLRDELFVQLMKQMTCNPRPVSKSKGEVLMFLALRTFPPSEELENVLEFYLRNNDMNRCVAQLHRIVYCGEAAQPPSSPEILEEREAANGGGKAVEGLGIAAAAPAAPMGTPGHSMKRDRGHIESKR